MNIADNLSKEVVSPLYLISGFTSQNNTPITIAYLGNDQKKCIQWSSLIMVSTHKIMLGEFHFSGLKQFLNKHHPECSLLLAEQGLPGVIEKIGGSGFSLPYFMQSFINISVPVQTLSSNSKSGFANAARLVRKYNLTYELVNSTESQHDFYYNMYLPYLLNRHGEIFQEVAFHNVFSKDIPFEIIQVKSNKDVLSGGVFRIKNGKAYFSFLGVKEGRFENVKKGALSAAYYFLCDILHQRGFDKLYLGGSPPFIKHPITKYKSHMLARIDHDYTYKDEELIFMALLRNTDGVRDFLSNSPFVSVDKSGKTRGVVWAGDKRTMVIPAELEKEVKRVFQFGLDECAIICQGNKNYIESGIHAFKDKPICYVNTSEYFGNRMNLWLDRLSRLVP
jgi:hypothetical protein